MMSTALARMKAKSVRMASGCVVWTGATGEFGHGVIRVDGSSQSVHRVAWTLLVGPIPEDLQVLHHCDVPPCWEPKHLFLGTQLDNMRDMEAKGRSGRVRGGVTRRKLPVEIEQAIAALRAAGAGDRALGRAFGIGHRTVRLMAERHANLGNPRRWDVLATRVS